MAGPEYRTNGSAAYDVHVWRGTEAPRIDPQSLPEERPLPVKKHKIKAKTNVSPLAIVGLAATIFLFVLVIFGYVQLYETSSEVAKLEQELSAAEMANEALSSQYEGRIDLAAIEEKAIHELGMSQPMSSQNVYLNLSGEDRAVISRSEEQGFFSAFVDACVNGVQDLRAYIGHKKK